jgi:hypothetical protein
MSATVAEPPWLDHLRRLADALESGGPLPPSDVQPPPSRPTLRLIRGGLDEHLDGESSA